MCDQKWGQCEMWKHVFVTMVLGFAEWELSPFCKSEWCRCFQRFHCCKLGYWIPELCLYQYWFLLINAVKMCNCAEWNKAISKHYCQKCQRWWCVGEREWCWELVICWLASLSEWMCAVEWRQWLTMATGCFSGRKFVHFVDFVCFE
jgi:hypothetical protein